MDLQEKFVQACNEVERLLNECSALVEIKAEAQETFDRAQEHIVQHEEKIKKAIAERDSVKAMMSVVPPDIQKSNTEIRMEERQAVFTEFRKIPNMWIMPQGLAALSGVDELSTAAILRRASGLTGVPVVHNGKRGRGSMYMWVEKK